MQHPTPLVSPGGGKGQTLVLLAKPPLQSGPASVRPLRSLGPEGQAGRHS